jgi:hypothetical protein
MDQALQLVIEMNEQTWQRFKAELSDVTPGELQWRPLPHANTINEILRHLRIEAQHWGQIRTLRNWYRKTRGEPGRFFPDNPTFPA